MPPPRSSAKRDFSGAWVDDIAARTAKTERMIYYYFDSKEQAYAAVLDEPCGGKRDAERALHLDGGSLRKAMRRLIEVTFNHRAATPISHAWSASKTSMTGGTPRPPRASPGAAEGRQHALRIGCQARQRRKSMRRLEGRHGAAVPPDEASVRPPLARSPRQPSRAPRYARSGPRPVVSWVPGSTEGDLPRRRAGGAGADHQRGAGGHGRCRHRAAADPGQFGGSDRRQQAGPQPAGAECPDDRRIGLPGGSRRRPTGRCRRPPARPRRSWPG